MIIQVKDRSILVCMMHYVGGVNSATYNLTKVVTGIINEASVSNYLIALQTINCIMTKLEDALYASHWSANPNVAYAHISTLTLLSVASCFNTVPTNQ